MEGIDHAGPDGEDTISPLSRHYGYPVDMSVAITFKRNRKRENSLIYKPGGWKSSENSAELLSFDDPGRRPEPMVQPGQFDIDLPYSFCSSMITLGMDD